MKYINLSCFALGCVLISFLLRRGRRGELDPVARLRLAGAL